MTPAREFASAAVGCLAGASIVLLAASTSWAEGEVARGAGVPVTDIALSGGDLAPAATGLAVLALAAVAALVATGGVVRRAVGGLVLVAGAWLALDAGLAASRAAATVAADAPDATGIDLALTPWPWAAVAGGLVVAAAGLSTVVRGAGWPTMSRRYDAPTGELVERSAARSTDRGAGDTEVGPPADRGAAGSRSRSPEELWRALDRGDDPTS